MAFTVQDDTGLVANANAYITVAELIAYFADRNITIAVDDDANQAAIIRGTSYVDQRFEYLGKKLEGRDQTTQWPRDCVYVECEQVEGVPREVKSATAEYAYRALQADDGQVASDPTTDSNVKREQKKLDVLEKETEYWSSGYSNPVYPTADKILTTSGLTKSGQKFVGRA